VPLERELGGYEIVGRLAVGGMAEVYQARPLATTTPAAGEGPEVVLKRLLPAYRNDGAHVKHFIDEAKIAVRLQHRHLVRTFRCFKSGADYLMVQELVPGRTLGYFLELLIQAGTPMPLPAANYIGWCLLDALSYLHGGIGATPAVPLVHRDMNPSNVLLSVTGDVKLTDFGIAEFDGFPASSRGAARNRRLHEPGAGGGRRDRRPERPVLGRGDPGSSSPTGGCFRRRASWICSSASATPRSHCSSRSARGSPSTSPGWCARPRSPTGRGAFRARPSSRARSSWSRSATAGRSLSRPSTRFWVGSCVSYLSRGGIFGSGPRRA
jgi:serine/threonine protein kinase